MTEMGCNEAEQFNTEALTLDIKEDPSGIPLSQVQLIPDWALETYSVTTFVSVADAEVTELEDRLGVVAWA